jgi:hypothetical protein
VVGFSEIDQLNVIEFLHKVFEKAIVLAEGAIHGSKHDLRP